MYTISCPEGMERDGGDDVRTCTADENSTVGVWNGTAPTCAGIIICISYIYYIDRCIFSFLQLRRCIYLMGTHTTMPTIVPSSFQAL